MRLTTRASPIAAVAIALLTAGCADFILPERIEYARTALAAHPGAVEAQRYAEAVHDAAAAGTYAGWPAQFRRLADAALQGLARSQASAGPDKPKLVAWRGVLLGDLGRYDESWNEVQRSMTMRPTLIAARALVTGLHRHHQREGVVQTCVRSAGAITDRNELFDLIDLCAANMEAPNEAEALAWATPETRAFFEDERARRRREADEQRAREAADFQMQAMQNTQQLMDQAALAAQMATQQAIDAATLANQQVMMAPPR
jgi:hypothetical protein